MEYREEPNRLRVSSHASDPIDALVGVNQYENVEETSPGSVVEKAEPCGRR